MIGANGRWGLCALVAALAFLVVDTVGSVKHLCLLRAFDDIHVASPALDPRSETGYALGQRRLILPGATIDSYHEIMQTQRMLAGGPWRIRQVAYDNAPQGREVHWAFPMRGWLGFLAWISHQAGDRSLGAAVEDAALVANPILLAIFLLLGVPWVCRRFGAAAGGLLAAGVFCSYPFYINFVAGNAEHQGMAAALAFLTVAPLLGRRAADNRSGFLASAVAGGLGLWISTASEAPVLLGVGIGALLSTWIARPATRHRERTQNESLGGFRYANHRSGWIGWRRLGSVLTSTPADYWRLWGWVGATISLAAYLLEYFPSHLGWRFEVNHPIYALAWAAGGEVLRWSATSGRAGHSGCSGQNAVWSSAPGGRAPPRAVSSSRDLRIALAAMSTVAAVAAVIVLTRRATFWISDPFLWRLHSDYIEEFQSMPWYLIRHQFALASSASVLPLLLSALVLGFALRRKTDPVLRSQLALALGPALVATALALGQIRWWGLASGLSIASTCPLLASLREPGVARATRTRWRLACALLLVPGAVAAVRLVGAHRALTEQDIQGLAERDFAHWLRAGTGPRPPVVLSSPSLTTDLIFHGGMTGVGTLYWENRAGLRAAAAICDAPTPELALAQIHAAGVTHIIAASWDPFLGAYVRLDRGLAPSDTPRLPYFAAGLLGQAPLPSWLRRVPYTLPNSPVLTRQAVVVYKVDQ